MESSASGVSASVQGAGNGSDIAPQSLGSQTSSNADQAPPAQAAKSDPAAVAEDPDWDFGEGKKIKRSAALERIKNFEKGAQKAMYRAAEATKSATELRHTLAGFGVSLEDFKRDPAGALKKAAHAHVAREVDESLMDPKERDAQQRERTLSEREAEVKKFQEQRQQEESESRASARAEQIAESYAPALKQAGLPANPKTVARMADVMIKAYRKGISVNPLEAAEYVAAELNQEQEWHLSQAQDANALIDRIGPKRLEMLLDLPVDQLAAKLGPKRMDALREWMLAQHRPQHPNRPTQPTVTQPETPARKYLGWEDYTKLQRGK